MAGFSVRVDGLPEVKRAVSWYTDRELHNRMRRAVRAGGKEFQGGLKAAAASEPTGNVPQSFKRVPAPKVSSSNRGGRQIVARVKPKSALFNIFEPGAGAHTIAPKGKPLAGFGGGFGFWTPGSRKRGKPFYSRKAVRHPGMAARPLMPTAFAAEKRDASDVVARVLFEPPRR